MIEDLKRSLNEIKVSIQELKEMLAIDDKRKEIKHIEEQMSDNSFWEDQERANKITADLKSIKEDVETWDKLSRRTQDCHDLLDVADDSYLEDIENEIQALRKNLLELRKALLFQDKSDVNSAYMEINSGAGGTEACDWAQMLFRMYFRWAEAKNFKVKVLNEVRGEEVGFKNITFMVKGRRAYGYLKGERGVHRLVRISPFDSNKRRHTSFASVAVYPQITSDIKIDIKQQDLRIDTFRAGGAGGQHVNKTDSAVRITHLPTNIVVSCQNERSQHQNKQLALSILKAKLYERKEAQRKDRLNKISGEKRKIEWGSQIRSYVLCPYLLVKDHRTNFSEHNAQAVLDGNLDDFMVSYLKMMLDNHKEEGN
jgi:peptide chain release factor 2